MDCEFIYVLDHEWQVPTCILSVATFNRLTFFLFFCFGGFSANHFSLYCVRKPNQKQKIQQSVGTEMALLQTNI